MRFHVCLVLLSLVWSGAPASAQAQNKQPLYEVDLKSRPEFPNGKTAFVEGMADPVGDRFQFPGTDIMQPIIVSVFTKDDDDHVRLRLVKDSWDEPEREAMTAQGRSDFKFRTHDGFRVWVTAEQETPYQLLVWIGDELVVPPPPVTIPMSEFRKLHPEAAERGSRWSARLLGPLVAAGLALLIAFVWWSRKRKSGAQP